ncbi:MAG: transketolase [bacterium]
MAAAKALIEELEGRARGLRCDVVKMCHYAGSGHPGGSLSAADMVAALYFHFMRLDPKNPKWEDRDRFIMSKGHACPVQYAALSRRGFFPEEVLWTLRKFESPLQGHPDMKSTRGLDMTSGSLGNGLSIGVGMALGARIAKKDFRVYVILGDGEIQEGLVWEGAMAAAHFQLDSLTAMVDYNKLQIDGENKDVMGLEPLVGKWQQFGWHTIEIDGHDMAEVVRAIEEAQSTKGKPTCIIAHTVKGKGVSYMECAVDWHGRVPTQEELDQALVELGEKGGKA